MTCQLPPYNRLLPGPRRPADAVLHWGHDFEPVHASHSPLTHTTLFSPLESDCGLRHTTHRSLETVSACMAPPDHASFAEQSQSLNQGLALRALWAH